MTLASLSSRTRLSFSTPTKAALTTSARFAGAVLVVDLLVSHFFGTSSSTLFGSYATVALLLFGDFQGTLLQRTAAFTVASLAGLLGLILGVLVAPALVTSLVAVFVVSLLLSLSRSLFGNVAKGAMGAQLAFLIAVMSPAPIGRLHQAIVSWLIGALIASLVGIFVFPQHPTSSLRSDLAAWCEAAAALATALAGSKGTEAAIEELVSAWQKVETDMRRLGSRPGWLGRRTRALEQLIEGVQTATAAISTYSRRSLPERSIDQAITTATVSGFLWCSHALREGPRGDIEPSIDLVTLRQSDQSQMIDWTAAQASSDAETTLAVLERHHAIRVLAVIAVACLHRTERYVRPRAPEPETGFPSAPTPTRVLLDTFSARSLWFRHGLQTAVGMSAAVWVARSIGVEHSFWIVMTTLGLLNGSFNPTTTNRGALKAGLGTAVGVAIGAVLLFFGPPLWLLGALVPVAAFATKWFVRSGMMKSQAFFTLFSLINTSFLGWPSRSHVAEVRLLNVVIGLVIAVGAMTLVFPGGTRILLQRSATSLRDLAEGLVAQAHAFVRDDEGSDALATLQMQCASEIGRYGATFSAIASGSASSAELAPWAQLEGWARETLLGTAMATNLATGPTVPRDCPEVLLAFREVPGGLVPALHRAVLAQPHILATQTSEIVRGLWAANWLDFIAKNEPAPPSDGGAVAAANHGR